MKGQLVKKRRFSTKAEEFFALSIRSFIFNSFVHQSCRRFVFNLFTPLLFRSSYIKFDRICFSSKKTRSVFPFFGVSRFFCRRSFKADNFPGGFKF